MHANQIPYQWKKINHTERKKMKRNWFTRSRMHSAIKQMHTKNGKFCAAVPKNYRKEKVTTNIKNGNRPKK